MAEPVSKPAEPRWRKSFHDVEDFADDLGALGAWLGPRTGPSKRRQGDKEDYVLRRLLVAWNVTKRLGFPFEVEAPADHREKPDFVMTTQAGERLGIEVTEAGSEDYQAWLTQYEQQPEPADLDKLPRLSVSSHAFVHDVVTAIERKSRKIEVGYYSTVQECDLAVYLNTQSGGYLDKSALVELIRQKINIPTGFRAVHMISDEVAWLDIFSNRFEPVALGHTYEIDYAGWIFDQVEKLRAGSFEDVDARNVAEELSDLGISERRDLQSQLERLLKHLMKWAYQPGKRGSSWQNSIEDAREKIYERLSESPSLKAKVQELYERAHNPARRWAVEETGLPRKTFPEKPPFTLDQALDPDFLPDTPASDEE